MMPHHRIELQEADPVAMAVVEAEAEVAMEADGEVDGEITTPTSIKMDPRKAFAQDFGLGLALVV